ncbi:thioredoxin [Amycolatopsis sp.]|jgi:thioredoxin 1|uniref:thioredoxin n=1 Tax=Amycolatopsis sp. TaxID=37632 RepID=UPI002E01AE8F|nr:thioredoxin [Amycolatopsis sp.]
METTVSGEITAVTDASFGQEVLQHGKPVLVDFWAEWCPPCRMIAPVLTEIAGERAGMLTIRKLNTDENPGTMRDFQVMSLPTLLLFRDGKPLKAFVGARPKAKLLAEIDAALAES